MAFSLSLAVALVATVFASPVDPPRLPAGDFERLHGLFRPQPGESPWREIPWLTSLRKGMERAVAENKPIVIFTAADGSPLGRT